MDRRDLTSWAVTAAVVGGVLAAGWFLDDDRGRTFPGTEVRVVYPLTASMPDDAEFQQLVELEDDVVLPAADRAGAVITGNDVGDHAYTEYFDAPDPDALVDGLEPALRDPRVPGGTRIEVYGGDGDEGRPRRTVTVGTS